MVTLSEALQIAVQYHQGNYLAQAEQVYRRILAVQPDQSEALYGLGILALQLGQFPTAEQYLRQLLQVQPNSVKVWVSLGNLHQAQSQWTEAVEAYQQALAIDPNWVSAHNNLGYTLQQQGKWSEALIYYQKALALQPNCPEAEVNWGNALYALGKLSPEQHAHYAALNNTLGIRLHEAGECKAAVAHFRQAIAIEPNLVEAHHNLGLALQKQGQWQEAIAAYEKVLELNPNFAEVHDLPSHLVEAYYHWGVFLQEQGEEQEAIACYQKVLELDPSYGGAYERLGQIYHQQNQFKEAASAYQQALTLINSSTTKTVEACQGTAATILNPERLSQLKQEMQALNKTHIVLACMPKTASTFLSNALALATGFTIWPLVFDYHRNEQAVYWPRLLASAKYNTVTQQHIRATHSNLALMEAFGIRTVLQIRHLADIVISLREHLLREDWVVPTAYFNERFCQLEESAQYEMIIELALPWFINYYVSWYEASVLNGFPSLWITYEGFITDRVGTIEKILTFHAIHRSEQEIQAGIESASKNFSRLNKRVSGRGQQLLSESQLSKLNQYTRHYPWVDFTPLGLENSTPANIPQPKPLPIAN